MFRHVSLGRRISGAIMTVSQLKMAETIQKNITKFAPTERI